MKHFFGVLRALFGYLTMAVVGMLGFLLMLATPGVERRRRIARATTRIVLAAAGIHLQVRLADHGDYGSRDFTRSAGLEKALPRGCVIVANHTSYLDGPILTAALPPHFAFVIKKEMSRVPVAGLLLRRIGSEFVDRFDRHRGAMDARRMLRRAGNGQAMVFFPEGTFSKEPGLLRFHSGAFVTAVRTGNPVVPVVIHGARAVLPHDRMLATPGTIQVEILAALAPEPDDAHAAVHLREETRRRILARLGEPDLAPSSHVAPILPADLIERA